MRTLWNALCFFCVVQVLALGMFAGWLFQSRRVSPERVETVRRLFAVPVDDVPAEPVAAPPDPAAGAEARSAEEALNEVGRMETQYRLLARRLQDEHARLSVVLDRRAQELAAAEADLVRRQDEWRSMVARTEAQASDAQFLRTVRLINELPPKQARLQILQMVETGSIDDAVAMLNAMNARQAGRILREFKAPGEVSVAADLLQRLRTLGLEPEWEPEEPHADRPSDAPGTAT